MPTATPDHCPSKNLRLTSIFGWSVDGLLGRAIVEQTTRAGAIVQPVVLLGHE